MASGTAMAESWFMQVFHQRASPRPASRLSLAIRIAIGILLLGLGVLLAYLAFATPFSERFLPTGRSSAPVTLAAALGWTLLIVAPAMSGIAGVAWLAGVFDQNAALRPRTHPVQGLATVLGQEYTAATNVRLDDGRLVPEIIVGPHGVAVFEPMPPTAFTRQRNGAWELMVGKDRWVPLENPLDRSVRTADRVRRWLAAGDRDFVVRVHAAVIAGDTRISRSAACAVITRDQVPAYLRSLPPQRGLTDERRAAIVEMIRGEG
jgi:uncharacterized membrane protein